MSLAARQFQIRPLPATPFASLYGRDEAALAALGVRVETADAGGGAPCRVSLEDAPAGARVLLMPYIHQPAPTPYRSQHAIYVTDGARTAQPAPGEIPEMIERRMLSVRAFSREGLIVDGDLVEGRALAGLARRLLDRKDADYLHVHFARFGCYAARIDRA